MLSRPQGQLSQLPQIVRGGGWGSAHIHTIADDQQNQSFHLPPPPRSALLCCSGEVQGLLSQVLKLLRLSHARDPVGNLTNYRRLQGWILPLYSFHPTADKWWGQLNYTHAFRADSHLSH